MIKIKKYYLTLAVIIVLTGCSTKKKTWVHRQYHNTTAKYNGYFNGNESIKRGIKKLQEDHKDDYSNVLSVYPEKNFSENKAIHSYMDKAIKKGSVVIQRHSINIRGKEYCRWIDDNYLMVGKAYFYKGDFDEAIKTFLFIKQEYKKNEIKYDASLWLIRAYSEKGSFSLAESEIIELENDKKFPKKLDKKRETVLSDYYLKQKNYPLALNSLERAMRLIKGKKKKIRMHYICAQIYKKYENYKKAGYHFSRVLRASPKYEMVFNTKMNLAKSLEASGENTEEIRKSLIRMTKDEKNIDYLDQIYFTLAEMDILNKDTTAALKNYQNSTINSIDNEEQMARSFFSMAKIFDNKKEYSLAKTNYDSTIYYSPQQTLFYNQAKNRNIILSELVYNLETIQLQDSLLTLSSLSNDKLLQIINDIIAKEKEKELKALEAQRQKQEATYNNNRLGGVNENILGGRTSSGKWYFYNPSTLAFGLSEFRKQWGKRKLEDNWRRKNKSSIISFEKDTTQKTENKTLETSNKKDPKYYLEKIPKTNKQIKISKQKIKEAHYQCGIILRQMDEYPQSTSQFLKIKNDYKTDKVYGPLAIYNLYINYTNTSQNSKAKEMKRVLKKDHPNSELNRLISDTNQHSIVLDQEELEYQKVYNSFIEEEYIQIISLTEKIKQNKYTDKYNLLRAMSFAKINDTVKLLYTLKEIEKETESESVLEQVRHLISVLKDPTEVLKANEQAKTKSEYLVREDSPHSLLLVMPKAGSDVNFLKLLVSDYNTKNQGTKVFEINAILLSENHLIIVNSFENKKRAMMYYNDLVEAEQLMVELQKTGYKKLVIALPNFQTFYKNSDISGYYEFFKKNYLDGT